MVFVVLVQVSLSLWELWEGDFEGGQKVKSEGQLSIFISMKQVNACPTRTG